MGGSNWASGRGVSKKASWAGLSSQARKKHSFIPFLSPALGHALTSFHDKFKLWTEIKPFPQVASGHGIYHSNRNQTKTQTKFFIVNFV